MSAYGKYLAERESFEIIENGKGFATYKIFNDQCYIRDIYIEPEFRRSKEASAFADIIAEKAKTAGCKMLLGSVSLQANNPTTSMKVLLGYGFEVAEFSGNLLWFKKALV